MSVAGMTRGFSLFTTHLKLENVSRLPFVSIKAVLKVSEDKKIIFPL